LYTISPKQQFTIPGGTEAIRYLRKIEKVIQVAKKVVRYRSDTGDYAAGGGRA
jgi:hypothetical protein